MEKIFALDEKTLEIVDIPIQGTRGDCPKCGAHQAVISNYETSSCHCIKCNNRWYSYHDENARLEALKTLKESNRDEQPKAQKEKVKDSTDNIKNNPYSVYLKNGFIPLLCYGYGKENKEINQDKKYKKAKTPINSGWNDKEYIHPTISKIKEWVEEGGWVGWIVPPGKVFIDIEDKEDLRNFELLCKKENINPSIHRTNKGFHFGFIDIFKLSAASTVFTKIGVKCTYRVGGKNYLILDPINNRKWDVWKNVKDLPEIPLQLTPYERKSINDVLDCLSWSVRKALLEGNLSGYEEIDAAYMAFLISCEIPEKKIHHSFKIVFDPEYDERRTKIMFDRATDKLKKGDPVMGPGSFIHSVNEKGLEEVVRFERELSNLVKKPEAEESEQPKGKRNITDELRTWLEGCFGNFNREQIHKDLGILTAAERNLIGVELHRQVEKGNIDRGKINGSFVKMDKTLTRITILEKVPDTIPLKLPGEVERWVKTYPNSLIVIAGATQQGKTAFCLNAAYNNRDLFPEIYYFSSEMWSEELTERIQKFNLPRKEWDKIQFTKRQFDSYQVIRPDALNFIDYLECPESEFYRTAEYLSKIHARLEKGIAVVALQMDKGKEYGRGGEMTKEKSRLYLILKDNILKIEKGKSWATAVNPDGMKRPFSLVEGCHFKWEDWESK